MITTGASLGFGPQKLLLPAMTSPLQLLVHYSGDHDSCDLRDERRGCHRVSH